MPPACRSSTSAKAVSTWRFRICATAFPYQSFSAGPPWAHPGRGQRSVIGELHEAFVPRPAFEQLGLHQSATPVAAAAHGLCRMQRRRLAELRRTELIKAEQLERAASVIVEHTEI